MERENLFLTSFVYWTGVYVSKQGFIFIIISMQINQCINVSDIWVRKFKSTPGD